MGEPGGEHHFFQVELVVGDLLAGEIILVYRQDDFKFIQVMRRFHDAPEKTLNQFRSAPSWKQK